MLGPAIPIWDEGASLSCISQLLQRIGYQVVMCDTVVLAREEMLNIHELTNAWRDHLIRLPRVDLLCGNAIGGAVALRLASALNPSDGLLTISAPAWSDATLDARLTEIVEAASCAADVGRAIRLLASRVMPAGGTHVPEPTGLLEGLCLGEDAARRLRAIRLLVGTRDDVDLPNKTPVTQIFGQLSQLACIRHAARSSRSTEVIEIDGAGMRPHLEARDAVMAAIQRVVASGEVAA